MEGKEHNIFMAKLAEQAERYEGKWGLFWFYRLVIQARIVTSLW